MSTFSEKYNVLEIKSLEAKAGKEPDWWWINLI